MPLIHVLWYLDQYLLDCGHADAVVVVDDTPAMAAKIAISNESRRTKVAFLGVSAIKQKDLANAVGGGTCKVQNQFCRLTDSSINPQRLASQTK